MLKASRAFAVVFGLVTLSTVASAQTAAAPIQTLEDYNASLIKFGVAWSTRNQLYYPSFYTGFAPKVEDANRIHFHLGRGNQARLTAPLDEQAVLTYLYSLKARAELNETLISSRRILPVQQNQVAAFQSIVASPAYRIAQTTQAFEAGKLSREQFYEASLATLKALNAGRVFDIKIDVRAAALAWRAGDLSRFFEAARRSGANSPATLRAYIDRNGKDALVVANNLLFGRINAFELNAAQKQKLTDLLSSLALSPVSDESFVTASVELLQDLTAGRYDFRTVQGGSYRKALECSVTGGCDLVYPEFTAVYPVGSVKEYTSDRDGNRIPLIREEGALKFQERPYHDVDHIRPEGYYGWIPKMDYTQEGNGIHNPAVRTDLSRGLYQWLYNELSIPRSADMLWVVARGGVSHGCTRMAAGHILEVRQIFPSGAAELLKVNYIGNNSADYDLFDIDGDGRIEVMGVDYLIAYALSSDSGAGYREGNGFVDSALKKDPFYSFLYGDRQFVKVNGRFVFRNPYISYFSGRPETRAVPFSVRMMGDYPLYEQAYEKDKMQFFDLPKLRIDSLQAGGNNKTNQAHQLVRLFGRVNACGPFAAEFSKCGEASYKSEMNALLSLIK